MEYYYEIRLTFGEYSRGSYVDTRNAAIRDGADRIYRYELKDGVCESDYREYQFVNDYNGEWLEG